MTAWARPCGTGPWSSHCCQPELGLFLLPRGYRGRKKTGLFGGDWRRGRFRHLGCGGGLGPALGPRPRRGGLLVFHPDVWCCVVPSVGVAGWRGLSCGMAGQLILSGGGLRLLDDGCPIHPSLGGGGLGHCLSVFPLVGCWPSLHPGYPHWPFKACWTTWPRSFMIAACIHSPSSRSFCWWPRQEPRFPLMQSIW